MSREILRRMARKRRWGTATSAIWNVTYLAEDTTFAPILMSLSRSVALVHESTLASTVASVRMPVIPEIEGAAP